MTAVEGCRRGQADGWRQRAMAERMKVLIGYDGSACAEAALDDLKRAGLPADAEAHILSVAEVWLPPPPPSSYDILEQAREVKVPADLKRVYTKGCAAAKAALALVERARERIKISFPDWAVSVDSACGSPAWELVFKADQWKPDLIVVGSHGRTTLERFVLGSVSQRVLTEARCSVRVARGRVEESDTPVRIIIGVDGSPGSLAAVRAVAKRTWSPNSEVKLVVIDDPLIPAYVANLIPPLAETIEEDVREDRAWAERIAVQSRSVLQDAKIKVSRELRHGDPKHELPKAAEEWGADCIFVGSAGFSNRFERFVLGSVSAAVAARAHCSVEVVRQSGTGSIE
jgi:nucleotide-binding universal stress UspA family protein